MRYRRKKRRGTVVILLLIIVIGAELAAVSRILPGGGLGGLLSFIQEDDTPADWRLILVNAENPIPENYDIELTRLSNGVSVDSRIYPDLQKMFDDAREHGVDPTVREGYRSRDEQVQMMESYVSRYINEGYSESEAKTLAAQIVAQPGTSENELGIAVDINGASGVSDETVYRWLLENAYRYGFILRYPSGKEDITGIDYEPWHYRYVGEQAALDIHTRQITLEEYLG